MPAPTRRSHARVPTHRYPTTPSRAKIETIDFYSPLQVCAASASYPSTTSETSFATSLLSIQIYPVRVAQSPEQDPTSLTKFSIPPSTYPVSRGPAVDTPSRGVLAPGNMPRAIALNHSIAATQVILVKDRPPDIDII